MKRRGLKPKNYHKDNLLELKKKKEEFVQKQKELEESKKQSNWKLAKFKQVPSLALKDKKEIEELKKEKIKRTMATKIGEDTKKTEPPKGETAAVATTKGKDYIKENAVKAQASPKKPEEKTAENVYTLNPHFGKVPK